MRQARIAGLLLCLLATAAQAAPCDSTAACLAALAAAQASTQSVDARFVQTKHLSLLDEPLVSTGRFRFRRPDHVRLDVETPRPSTILIAGRSVTIPGLPASEQQALADSPMAAMFTELGAVFAGNLERAPAHFTIDARAAGDAIEVTLTPTAPDYQRLFRTIALRFAGPETIIEWMRLDDALGDRLDVELRDVRRNVDLPDAVFAQP
ncbi:MAG TPA: outer membrane lipoprotein carrier protein LolA [Candidatus Dormibacteraeota bacterium]|nr:outer membrane lipoprotein carrier protein LolA [Candidatus Dormibacteraeota bacterium]